MVIKMKPNCIGCKEEFETALEYQDDGYHYASSKREVDGLENRKHFILLMVDDDGKIICW